MIFLTTKMIDDILSRTTREDYRMGRKFVVSGWCILLQTTLFSAFVVSCLPNILRYQICKTAIPQTGKILEQLFLLTRKVTSVYKAFKLYENLNFLERGLVPLLLELHHLHLSKELDQGLFLFSTSQRKKLVIVWGRIDYASC